MRPGNFFDWQRFARDGRLVDKRIAGDDFAIHGIRAPGLMTTISPDRISEARDFLRIALAPYRRIARKKIEQIFDSPPPRPTVMSFKNLGNQNKQNDDQSRKN